MKLVTSLFALFTAVAAQQMSIDPIVETGPCIPNPECPATEPPIVKPSEVPTTILSADTPLESGDMPDDHEHEDGEDGDHDHDEEASSSGGASETADSEPTETPDVAPSMIPALSLALFVGAIGAFGAL